MELSSLKQISSHKNVRFAQNKLFAAEGGLICFSSKIIKVETNPSNKFVINDNEIKFLGACEVVTLELENQDQIINSPKQDKFYHFDQPALPQNLTIVEDPLIAKPLEEKVKIENNQVKHLSIKERLIFTTEEGDISNYVIGSYKRGINIIKSGISSTVNMSANSSFLLRMEDIKPSVEYLICIEGQKVGGNGKLNIGFSKSNVEQIHLSERLHQFNFKLKNLSGLGELMFTRPPGSIGIINLRKIKISEQYESYEVEKYLDISSKNNVKDEIKEFKIFNSKSFNYTKHLYQKSSNVKNVSKINAIWEKEDLSPNKTFDLDFSIAPLTFSSQQWVNKILPHFPNASVWKGLVNFKSKKSDSFNLAICSSNNIISAENIYLEEWTDQLSQENLEILKSCKNITVSSFLNEIELLEFLPNQKINNIAKFWPSLNPTKPLINNKYAVYFEKNASYTKNIINIKKYISDYQLVVIGSRENLSPDIIQYSEYEDYKKIENILYFSNLLIDISDNNYYNSALVNYAVDFNIPIITNNTFYLTLDKENIFISRNRDQESIDYCYLKFANANLNIDKKNITDEYNNILENTLLVMLGKR